MIDNGNDITVSELDHPEAMRDQLADYQGVIESTADMIFEIRWATALVKNDAMTLKEYEEKIEEIENKYDEHMLQ